MDSASANEFTCFQRRLSKWKKDPSIPALYRMEAKGWIKAEWGHSERGRRAKLYSLTDAGRRQLVNERQSWHSIATAIGEILRNA